MLGQNPGTSNPRNKNSTLARLESWVDVLGLRYYSFSNVSTTPGKFSSRDVNFELVESWCYQADKVVTLGAEARKVVLLLALSHFPLPHPSGLNRQINEKERLERSLLECKNWIWA